MVRAQELEFIIHPDGRVEERVRGVKGVECQSLTEEINKALGEVYESKPTQEMYEQKIEISVEAENTVSESWSGSGTVRAPSRLPIGACDLTRRPPPSLLAVGQQREQRRRRRRRRRVVMRRAEGLCARAELAGAG